MNAALAPFRLAWRHALGPAFHALDAGLVRVAALFGALEPDLWRRVLWMNGLFLALYAVGALPVPGLSLAALLFAYVGVLAVGRAWVANEKLRTRIVKKLDDTDPDTLPDLRGAALLSILQLLVLFPLLLWQLSQHFPGKLFAVPPGASFGAWLEFAFEPYAKTVLDQFAAHSHEYDIAASTAAGRFVILLKRLTLDFIIIQGVIRVFAVSTTIGEAVGALGTHPDITVRLGRRAVAPLTDILKGGDPAAPATAHLRAQAAVVLGELRARDAVPALTAALADECEEVRWRAAGALAAVRDPGSAAALLRAVRDPDPNTARAALDGLIALDAKDAVPTLREWLAAPGPATGRALAAEGLQHLAGKDAVPALAAALWDADEEVGKTAAAALGGLRDVSAVGPLGAVVSDGGAPPWLRYEAAKALGAVGDASAVAPLTAGLADPDPTLRRLAARALGGLGADGGPALVGALTDGSAEVREAAARAVGAAKPADGPAALVRLLRDSHAEVRDAAADALAEYGPSAAAAVEAELGSAAGDDRERLEAVRERLRA
ncbi:MAG: hypothetical protein C0501_20085 [Isosphaera sp.]|nr:hypothetical protein [Isosphaera sp.]